MKPIRQEKIMIKDADCIQWLFTSIFVIVASSLFLFHYLTISNDEMPMMGFWPGFDGFATKLFNNSFTINDFITIPHPLHWTAIGAPLQIFFTKAFSCNNLAYVLCGGIINILAVILIMIWGNKYAGTNNIALKVMLGIAFAACITNLNQWEILDLWCSAGFMLRIFLFLAVFILLDRFLHSPDKTTKKIYKGIIYGLFSALLIIVVCAAYYPGYVAAIISVILLHLFISNDSKTSKMSLLPILLFVFAGTVFFFMTTMSDDAFDGTAKTAGIAQGTPFGIDYIRGFLVMLSSTIIPQTMFSGDYTLYIIIGTIILLFTIESIILFFTDRLYEKSWFPFECLVYAGVSIIIIIYGRSGGFGFDTLRSSRYVTETTIGLLGIIMIQAMAITKHRSNLKEKKTIFKYVFAIVIILCLTVCIIHADSVEYEIGPYRKAYNQEMINLALDIDNATDEQLSLFQAPAKDVRSGIQAMQKYQLGLWNKNSKYYQEEGITKIADAWEDGWVGQNAKFHVHTLTGSHLLLKGYYGKYANNGERITVILNNKVVKEYALESEEINISIELKPNYDGELILKSNFSFLAQSPDIRTLSFLLVESSINQ